MRVGLRPGDRAGAQRTGRGHESDRRGCEKSGGEGILISDPASSDGKAFRLYKKRGFRTAFRTRGLLTERERTGDPERVSPAEYRAVREALLAGKLHVDHNERSLKFQETLCSLAGGGLFRTDGGCFIAEGSEIKELLGGSAAGTAFSGLPARAPCGDDEGIPFGMIYGAKPAEDGWMGPVFD